MVTFEWFVVTGKAEGSQIITDDEAYARSYTTKWPGEYEVTTHQLTLERGDVVTVETATEVHAGVITRLSDGMIFVENYAGRTWHVRPWSIKLAEKV